MLSCSLYRAILYPLLLLVLAAALHGIEPPPLRINPLDINEKQSDQGQDADKEKPAPSARTTRFEKTVPREKTRVAILGYHDFSETKPITEMRMRTSDFRKQMQYIKDSELSVIDMPTFLEWLGGERELPANCVLITIDDGWRSVYTDAYPILKEYGYPFTIFLYSDYISGRGDSMNVEMIKELQKNGATVGSHSVSHPYPSEWNKALEAGEESLTNMINLEIGQSKKRLEKHFGDIDTYCYPGGYILQSMLDSMDGLGYTAAFNVIGAKVRSDESNFDIHRYIIFGTDDDAFERAMDFRLTDSGIAKLLGRTPGTLPPTTPPPPFPVSPRPKSSVAEDKVIVELSLNQYPNIDIDSITMKVSGYGSVPLEIDKLNRRVTWTPPSRILLDNLSVHLTWSNADSTKGKAAWSFPIVPRDGH